MNKKSINKKILREGSITNNLFDACPAHQLDGNYFDLYQKIAGDKQVESALRVNAEKFATIFHNANDAIYLMKVTEDKMPGRLIEVNVVASRQLGYTKKEFLSMTPEQIDDPEAYKKIPQIMKKLFSQKHITFETIHTGKNGRKIPVEVGAHLFSLNGALSAWHPIKLTGE